LGGGFRSGIGSVLNASTRWLLHEAVDPQAAYPPTSSLEVARIDFGVSAAGKVFVDEATALRIESLASAAELQSALAWKIDVGVRHLALGGNTLQHLGVEVDLGRGAVLLRPSYSAVVYSMVGTRLGVALENGTTTFLPAGIWSGGLLLRLPAAFRARVSGEYALSIRSLRSGAAAFKIVTRKGIKRDLDLELGATLSPKRSGVALGLASFR
jgi:hypothetical protein